MIMYEKSRVIILDNLKRTDEFMYHNSVQTIKGRE